MTRLLPIIATAAALVATGAEAGFDTDHGFDWPEARQIGKTSGMRLYRPTPGEFAPAASDVRLQELCAAAAGGNLTRVKALLAEGVSAQGGVPGLADDAAGPTVAADGADACRPLLAAVAAGQVEAVRLLLERGADANVVGADGRSALSVAALLGHVQVVGLLLKGGARVDAVGAHGNTALFDAVLLDHVDVVRQLLRYRPDLTWLNRDGYSAAGIAAREGHVATLAVLLDHGADIDLPDRGGHPPLFWAVAKRQRLSVALLVARGAQVGTMSVDLID